MVECTMAEKLFQSPSLLTLLSDLDHKEECTTREDLSSYLCELYDVDTLVEGREVLLMKAGAQEDFARVNRRLQRHKKRSLAEEILLLSTFLDGSAKEEQQVREDKLGYYDSDLESLSECDVNVHLQYPNVSSLKCQISMILHKVMVIEDRLRRLTGSRMDLLSGGERGNMADFDETLDDVATESDPGTGDSGYSGSGLKAKTTDPMFSPCRGTSNCRYTCHVRCRPSVSLECSTPTEGGSPFATPDSPTTEHARLATTNLNSPDLNTSSSGHMTKEEVRRAVERYNAETNGLVLQLQSDGESFRGYIRVHMNLSRPVTVAAGTRPLTLYGSLRINDQEDTIKETTTFHLPRDTIKALHITSDTTVREVIQALLKKFKVTDNPRKFALFEKTVEQEGNVLMRVLPDTEEPLHLSLQWGPNNTQHEFVLQENEFTGEIMWDAFSLPELHNFLIILDREEDEHMRQVMDRYNTYKEKLEEALLGVSPAVQCSA
ncbi:RASSF5 [Branchiostoma lanceolatum]|uniref:RASSF5 protein n=1 Tax=Branchiostoma lanceolatum TaxID=7740 RepID=A0A8K0EV92_BRALA|nr:RASSF5 [Branchiostoma lanceolatum]